MHLAFISYVIKFVTILEGSTEFLMGKHGSLTSSYFIEKEAELDHAWKFGQVDFDKGELGETVVNLSRKVCIEAAQELL